MEGAGPGLTATDVNRAFAVDVFAKKNDLFITDMALAKEVSAALLAGKGVGFVSDLPAEDALPDGLPAEDALPDGLTAGAAELGIAVTAGSSPPFGRTLFLVPRRYALGVGCRRGKGAAELAAFVRKRLEESGVCPEELARAASIDLKKDEPGLLTLCEGLGVPVGFVNVIPSKERIIETDVPCIVARGRKGGSNVAACIVNALLYELDPARGS